MLHILWILSNNLAHETNKWIPTTKWNCSIRLKWNEHSFFFTKPMEEILFIFELERLADYLLLRYSVQFKMKLNSIETKWFDCVFLLFLNYVFSQFYLNGNTCIARKKKDFFGIKRKVSIRSSWMMHEF